MFKSAPRPIFVASPDQLGGNRSNGQPMQMNETFPASRALRRAGLGGLAAGAIVWSTAAMAAESPVADLVERVSPSVVTVFTSQEPEETAAAGRERFGFPEGSPFEEFFRRFGRPDGIPGIPGFPGMPGPD